LLNPVTVLRATPKVRVNSRKLLRSSSCCAPVATQNSLALRGTVSIAARLLTAAAATVAAHVPLSAIRAKPFRTSFVL